MEQVHRNIYPKAIYQIRERLFGELRAFDFEFLEEKSLFNNFAVSDSESFFVKDSSLTDTETIT